MVRNKRDLTYIVDNLSSGLLIRSAKLNRATKEDLSDISLVIDLRNKAECDRNPDRVVHDVKYKNIPIFDSGFLGIGHDRSLIIESSIPELTDLYKNIMCKCRSQIKDVVYEIMHHEFSTGGVLWHCSEGKDRSGIITALILSILGVRYPVIMKDYLRTNESNKLKATYMYGLTKLFKGKSFADRIYRVFTARPEYLLAIQNDIVSTKKYLDLTDADILEFRCRLGLIVT